jgi:hypothetical protein
MQAAKKGTMFAIYIALIIESINGSVALSTYNKEYQDIFKKINANMLSQHCLYDCTIDI